MGTFIYDQIHFKDHNQKIEINGQELNPFQSYSLAIPDMFTFGPFFPELDPVQRQDVLPSGISCAIY